MHSITQFLIACKWYLSICIVYFWHFVLHLINLIFYYFLKVNSTLRAIIDFTTSFEVEVNLSFDTIPDNVKSVTAWYSTKSDGGSPNSPPQDAHLVHGSNVTSLKITLPNSSDLCQPHYIWAASFAPNGQRSTYSKKRRVEICSRTYGMMYNRWVL